MIGITLLRVSNTGSAASGTVAAGTQQVWPEGQIANIELDYVDFRRPTSDGPSGSVAGPKAKITKASVNVPSSTTFTASSTLIIELGYLDNDGYFVTHLSSVR